MKTLVKTLILSSVIVMTASSAAIAGDYPISPKQQRMERNWEYWNQKNMNNHKADTRQVSSNTSMPKVSQYPCSRCVYDHQLGGYVEKTLRK